MPSLKEVRNRIVSVTSTQQITSAMKMVSAAKLRRAQEAILRMRPYAEKLQDLLGNLSSSVDTSEGNPFGQVRDPKKVLIIAVSSNRGLAGAFNANVIKTTRQLLAQKYPESWKAGQVSLVCIGKKVSDYFQKNKYNVLSHHSDIFEKLSFTPVAEIAETCMKLFLNGEYDRIEIVYNRFKNAAVQIPVAEQWLPILPPDAVAKTGKQLNVPYIYEPSQEEIVETLIPKSLKIQLYKAILDSHAAEHGARMTAMNKATDNAKELIKALKLSYNKARQASITNEILEIVGGAEALKS